MIPIAGFLICLAVLVCGAVRLIEALEDLVGGIVRPSSAQAWAVTGISALGTVVFGTLMLANWASWVMAS